MELALTGDPIAAERAHEIGIVNRLAEPGEALDGARELAAAIVQRPAGARGLQADRPAATTGRRPRRGRGRARSRAVFASEDAQEGAKAFAEKRAPVWRAAKGLAP